MTLLTTASTFLSANESQNLALHGKKSRDEGIASDIVMSEESVDAIAYAMRAKLIDGICADNNDDSFEEPRPDEFDKL